MSVKPVKRVTVWGTLSMFCFLGTLGAEPGGGFDHHHTKWNKLLNRFVEKGWVDYAGLKKEESSLKEYLLQLQTVSRDDYEQWTREQQLAFWINAYNASTVQLILNHYPIKSIRKIGWLPGAAFRESFIPIVFWNGEDLSLNDVENDILRSVFKDPRIHFAIVCASKSCPSLRSEAYCAEKLERQLESAARRFVNDPSKNRFDSSEGTLLLSSIFNWFRSDFESQAGTIVNFVSRYASSDLASALESNRDPTIHFMTYDWSLNGK